ncbi:MAG: MFS transporter [Desulfuromonas sp.]|nr:MFS transporter [Desulfuromonas sp.]
MRGITGNVLVLGLVSLLTDVSSEMIYPLLPLFLTGVLGAGPAFLGVIEGVAESTAALLKLASGYLSDRLPRRKPLVVAGYGLSALARPLIALAASPGFVLGVRFCDRIGKGVRTSPRDALIADSVAPELRGRAYGFHRSMDHAGALVGPLLAAGLLGWFSLDLRTVFWCAAIPGLLAVLLLAAGIREQSRPVPLSAHPTGKTVLPHGKLRAYLLILLLFTLGNSSDAFLLLRAGELGVAPARLPLLWSFFHLVKMSSVFPFGALSDRIGRRGVIVAGWTVYAAAYLGFAVATSEWHIWLLFAVYGLFYGLTEGAEKALVADLAPAAERGSAFGWFNATIGLGALPASLLFGALWQWSGPLTAFGCGAALAAVAAVLLLALVRVKERQG